MQFALLSLVVLGSLAVAAGSVITWVAVRRAPEGTQDSTGFHTVTHLATIENFPTANTEMIEFKKAA